MRSGILLGRQWSTRLTHFRDPCFPLLASAGIRHHHREMKWASVSVLVRTHMTLLQLFLDGDALPLARRAGLVKNAIESGGQVSTSTGQNLPTLESDRNLQNWPAHQWLAGSAGRLMASEAIRAINRPIATGLEGYLGIFPALSAYDVKHLALAI